jgi:hypothetical protein
MAFTTYLANKVLDHIIGKTSFTMPTIYVGLYKADPTNAGTQTAECVYTGYARVAAAGSVWVAAASRAINNTTTITFGAKTAGTDETVTHWATFDAATSGNMLSFGPMAASQLISNGSVPTIPPGNAAQSFN